MPHEPQVSVAVIRAIIDRSRPARQVVHELARLCEIAEQRRRVVNLSPDAWHELSYQVVTVLGEPKRQHPDEDGLILIDLHGLAVRVGPPPIDPAKDSND